MLAHCNLKQNMCLHSKQPSLFSFYALPSGGKSKDAVAHWFTHPHVSFLAKVQAACLIVSHSRKLFLMPTKTTIYSPPKA